ncbi:MAG: DDE transposase family protein [Tepidibacillus sp.]
MKKNYRTSAHPKGDKIIPMSFNANFFFERAMRQIDRNNYTKALKYFWRTVDFEPNNPIHFLNIAGLLSEMGRFPESNNILLHIVEKLDPTLTECYFYLANNYAHMEDMESAYRYIQNYIEAEPDGVYIEEALEMVEYLSMEIEQIEFEEDEEQKELLLHHHRIKSLLEEGKFYEAIKQYKHFLEEYPDFLAARNNLALAYFYIGNTHKAIEQTKIVLEHDHANIHALCNLAIFYQQTDELEQLKQVLELLKKVYPIHPEQLYKLATTFAILGEHEKVFEHFSRSINVFKQHDPVLLHYAAMAAFNMKRYTYAQKWWEQILKIDSKSMVARFYLDLLSQVEKHKVELTFPVFTYHYELPFEELINLLKQEPKLLKQDPFILSSLTWAIENGDDEIKEVILLGLGLLDCHKAEEILRDFLLDEQQSTSLKKKAVTALEEMRAKPPYLVKINGKVVQFERQTPDFRKWKQSWLEVLEWTEKFMKLNYSIMEVYDAKMLWYEFISKTQPDTPQIRKVKGWVAALEYLVAIIHQKPISFEALTMKYQVSKQTISKHVQELRAILQVSIKTKALNQLKNG